MPRHPGRETQRTQALALTDERLDYINERIAYGDWNQQACDRAGVDKMVWLLRRRLDPDCEAAYQVARRQSAEHHADMAGQIMEDTDDPRMAQLANYKTQAFKWQASMRDRQTFGEKVDLTSGGKGLADILQEAAKLRAGGIPSRK